MLLRTFTLSLLTCAALLLCSCGEAAPVPTSATPTPAPTQTLTPIPTHTPPPTLTPTPQAFLQPAQFYLPVIGDFPEWYELEDSLVSENALASGQIPVPPEAIAAVSLRNKGERSVLLPQDGMYSRLMYWVVTLPDANTARFYYNIINSTEYIKQAFFVIMPPAIHEDMTSYDNLPPGGTSPCEEGSGYSARSDVYSNYYYGSAELPTPDPRMPLSWSSTGRNAGQILPDRYVYSICRVNNVLVMFWGHTLDNYDGKRGSIPLAVLTNQADDWLELAVRRLAP